MYSHAGRVTGLIQSTRPESALGHVSRASPVYTALRNCTGDEGGPFGFGDQVADPKPPRAAVVKATVVSVAETSGP